MEITLVLGVLVGAVLGLTGAGGGILAVPALVAGLGWSVQRAAPVALIAVGAGALVGALEGLRQGVVRYRAALVMVAAGMPMTSVGERAAQLIPQRALLGVFAGVMLWVAWRLFMRARAGDSGSEAAPAAWIHLDAVSGRFQWSWPTALLFAALGAVTGVLTGLLGIGGGFVIVPALRRFTDLPMRGIVATSLMVIALVATAAIGFSLLHGTVMPLQITLWFTLSMVAGMVLGRRLAARLSENQVQCSFALVLVLVALGLLVKAGAPL